MVLIFNIMIPLSCLRKHHMRRNTDGNRNSNRRIYLLNGLIIFLLLFGASSRMAETTISMTVDAA